MNFKNSELVTAINCIFVAAIITFSKLYIVRYSDKEIYLYYMERTELLCASSRVNILKCM